MEKLKAYLLYSGVLLCVFLTGGLLYASLQEEVPETSVASTSPALPRVVIDAGHGGEDGGAEANGLLEKDVNLSIALRLRDMLTAAGFETEMVRTTDRAVYTDPQGTIREKKRSDLLHREELMNSRDDQIFVSIHQNQFPQEQYSGAQMFYAPEQPDSRGLAEEIRRAVTSLLQPDNRRECKPGKDIYLLTHAQVPAVIVECGFLSNPQEASLLSEEEYRQKMAFAVFCGVVSYVSGSGGKQE